MEPAELVERVVAMGLGRLDEALELLHPDVVWIVDAQQPALHGLESVRAFVMGELERVGPDVPKPIPISVTSNGDLVLVCGLLRIPRSQDGRRYVELRQVASVHQVAGERVARVTAFQSWAEARAAAGIAPGTPPTRRLSGWRLAVRWRLRSSALGHGARLTSRLFADAGGGGKATPEQSVWITSPHGTRA